MAQLIILSLLMMGLGIHLVKDGEEMNQKYSFSRRLINVILWIILLWIGGFWDVLL